VQQGTTARPTNYWLSVSAQTTAGAQLLFGWHTSSDSYNDIAVWGNAPFPAAWNTLIDPQGIPLSLAFKVTTPTNPPCPPGTIICPPNKTVECGSSWNFDDPRATNACCGTNVTLIILGTTTNGTPCTALPATAPQKPLPRPRSRLESARQLHPLGGLHDR